MFNYLSVVFKDFVEVKVDLNKQILADIEKEIAIRKTNVTDTKKESQDEIIDISDEVTSSVKSFSNIVTQKLTADNRNQNFPDDDSNNGEDYSANLLQETRRLIIEKQNIDRSSKIIDNHIVEEAKV